MITVISAVLENVCYSIVFEKLKYRFMVDEECLFESTSYMIVRAEWGNATKF